MSFTALDWAWGQELEAGSKLVLLGLADQADAEGRCWPSIGVLASKSSMSEGEVRRRLGVLCDLGLIACEAASAPNGSGSEGYRLCIGSSMLPSPVGGGGC